MIRPRRKLSALLAAGALTLCAAPAADAGVLTAAAGDCPDRTLEQPFLPWADLANYVLADDGTFESGAAGWTLSGGAATGSGNEPWNVHGAGESNHLALPAGSSATSGVMCVGIEHPTVRFFAKQTGGSALGTLQVEVLWEDSLGGVHSTTMAHHGGSSSWHVSPAYLVVVNLLPLLPGDRTPVAFRLTPSAGTSWQVDDFYVDPWSKR